MKDKTHLSKEQGKSPAAEVNTDTWQETCRRVLVRDGLRCRICNAPGKLLWHSRTNEHQRSQLNDVLALCEDCFQLAHICKRKRIQSKKIRVMHLVCIVMLFLPLFVVIMALAILLPLALFLLCVASMYGALGITSLTRRWF